MGRNEINDAIDGGTVVQPRYVKTSVYTEFTEFTRKEIKEYEKKFKMYNESGSGTISLNELKTMMEKLQAPQTHLGLKAMIKEVDEDDDGAISFREFLIIFRKAAAGELDLESGLGQLATLTEIDVDEVGVGGAKTFFEAKASHVINSLSLNQLSRLLRSLKAANLKKRSKRSKNREREKRRRKNCVNRLSGKGQRCSAELHN